MKSFYQPGSLTNAILCLFQYEDTYNALADAWDADKGVSPDALDEASGRVWDQKTRILHHIRDRWDIPSIYD